MQKDNKPVWMHSKGEASSGPSSKGGRRGKERSKKMNKNR